MQKLNLIFASIFVLVITYFFQSKEQYKTDGLVNHSVKYFMPVYVLHTIVAAGVRTVLLKIGISSGVLHFMIGFSVSVFVPVVIYMIAEKQWWLLFWFEPIKAMKLRNQKKPRVKDNEDKTVDKKEYKSKNTVYRCFWLFC